jgi:hypothetical protein
MSSVISVAVARFVGSQPPLGGLGSAPMSLRIPMFWASLVASAGSVASAAALSACGPGARPAADADLGGPDAEPDVIDAAPLPDGEFVDFSKVYAHGNGNLYRVDSDTFEPELVAPITGLLGGSLTDLAIDKNDVALGITLTDLYTVDLATGVATLLREDSGNNNNFTSLSFVPLDLDNPDSAEILVAADGAGDVFEIDPATGDTTLLGNYGGGGPTTISSSGDIVAISGLGIFATVTVGDDFSAPDHLAKINPDTWFADTIGVGTGYDKIFGLGYWAGKFFGFVDNGAGAGTGTIIEISDDTGEATVRHTGSVRWYGAGVTTDAPVID